VAASRVRRSPRPPRQPVTASGVFLHNGQLLPTRSMGRFQVGSGILCPIPGDAPLVADLSPPSSSSCLQRNSHNLKQIVNLNCPNCPQLSQKCWPSGEKLGEFFKRRKTRHGLLVSASILCRETSLLYCRLRMKASHGSPT
jgi:hypothetical protein